MARAKGYFDNICNLLAVIGCLLVFPTILILGAGGVFKEWLGSTGESYLLIWLLFGGLVAILVYGIAFHFLSQKFQNEWQHFTLAKVNITIIITLFIGILPILLLVPLFVGIGLIGGFGG